MKTILSWLTICLILLAIPIAADLEILSPKDDMYITGELPGVLQVPLIITNIGSDSGSANVEKIRLDISTNGTANITIPPSCDKEYPNLGWYIGKTDECYVLNGLETVRFLLEFEGIEFGDHIYIVVRNGNVNRVKINILKVDIPVVTGNDSIVVFNVTHNETVPPRVPLPPDLPPEDTTEDSTIEEPVAIAPIKKSSDWDDKILILFAIIALMSVLMFMMVRLELKRRSTLKIRSNFEKSLDKNFKKVELRLFNRVGDGWEALVVIEEKPFIFKLNNNGKVVETHVLQEEAWIA